MKQSQSFLCGIVLVAVVYTWYVHDPALGIAGSILQWWEITAHSYKTGSLFGQNRELPFMEAWVPIASVLFYLVTVKLFEPSEETKAAVKAKSAALREKGESAPFTFFKFLCLLHNILLCGFSAWCFVVTCKIVPDIVMNDFAGGVSSRFSTIFTETDFGRVAYYFYLSKIYEFLDTYILLIKGTGSSFLQTFHHVGAVLGMWWCCSIHSKSTYLFVGLNSFIHTIMYGYHACTTLNIRPPKIFKVVLTSAQMTQFFIGNATSMLMFTYGTMGAPHVVCTTYHIIYTTILFYLFLKFAQRKYRSKQKSE